MEGAVAIVTGAAGGLGRVYAQAFAREGYRVVVADLADPSDVVAEIDGALGVRVDVSDLESTEAMAREVLKHFGRIDVLVNNAAYYAAIEKRPFDELTVEEWDRCFAVNVRGTWLCCRAVTAAMKERRYGKIINVSSMTVPSGIPFFLHYVSSKAAIVGLTRSLARELGDYGICVNTVTPDYIAFDRPYDNRQPEMRELLAAQRCFKREEAPEDMVGTVLFLAGPGSNFITGQNIWVNGGRLFN
jgi:3-oxoacyl-[acyl-carrier protein] reductase